MHLLLKAMLYFAWSVHFRRLKIRRPSLPNFGLYLTCCWLATPNVSTDFLFRLKCFSVCLRLKVWLWEKWVSTSRGRSLTYSHISDFLVGFGGREVCWGFAAWAFFVALVWMGLVLFGFFCCCGGWFVFVLNLFFFF